ncbi:MAG: nitroreductase family protein [Thermoplasmatota archaeon]
MDVLKAIKKRQSVRNYTGEEIPKRELLKLLDAARSAPSAKNLQPWELVVVTDDRLKKDLVEIFHNQAFIADAGLVIIGLTENEKWADIDLAIALDHFSIAATALGMGTCWLGAFKSGKLRKKLNIPERFNITVCMSVGYPINKDNSPVKKSIHELVNWNEYGKKGMQKKIK